MHLVQHNIGLNPVRVKKQLGGYEQAEIGNPQSRFLISGMNLKLKAKFCGSKPLGCCPWIKSIGFP